MSDVIVVVGVDGTRTSILAAKEALWLAEQLGADLHLVNVVRTPERDSNHEMAMAVLSNVVDGMRSAVPIITAVAVGSPAQGLIHYADEVGATVLVTGNRQMKGVGRVLGSVGAEVARDANCAVYIPRTVELMEQEAGDEGDVHDVAGVADQGTPP